EDFPALASGQGHHEHPVALIRVAGKGGGALTGLVVRVGVHRHQSQLAHMLPDCVLSVGPIVPGLIVPSRMPGLKPDHRAPIADTMTEGSLSPPQTRYGRGRMPRPSRRRAVALAVVAVTAGLAL